MKTLNSVRDADAVGAHEDITCDEPVLPSFDHDLLIAILEARLEEAGDVDSSGDDVLDSTFIDAVSVDAAA